MKADKIILAGGSGFLGQIIINHFYNTQTKLIVLTRSKNKTDKNVNYMNWDGANFGEWVKEIDETDVVINLTGKSVDCRYTEKNKKEIISSRVNATAIIGKAIQQSKNPPKLWMNASSATIYRHSEDKAMDDYSTDYGDGFSIDVCKQWENAFNNANTPKTRKIALRISMILGKDGGVWPVLSKLVKYGLGGKQGSGMQYISWMHDNDFLNAILWFIENEAAKGAYNLASPNPIVNKEFMKLMRNKFKIPFGLPSYSWMLEIGAFVIGTETELVLKSRRVISKRLLDEGFQFKYADVNDAMDNLILKNK